jgi:hypothetical protein
MVTGAILGALVVSYIKPDLMYENGVPRPWIVFGKSGTRTPTYIPWYSASLTGALILGVLI